MNKLFISLVVVGFFVLGQSAQAQISDTGPGSHNSNDQQSNTSCSITNVTDIDIENNNDQSSSSGGANSEGNANGGDSTSGDASNSSTVDTDISIDNAQDCTPAAATSSERPVGGMGGGGAHIAAQSPQVKTMPVGGVGAGEGSMSDAIRQIAIMASSLGILYAGIRRIGAEPIL